MHPVGTMLEWDDGASFIELGLMKNITPFSFEKGETDNTGVGIVDTWKETIPALNDGGDIPFSLYFNDATMLYLVDLFDRKPYEPADIFRVSFPLLLGQVTPALMLLAGWLKSKRTNEGSITSNDPYCIESLIRVTGKPVFFPATT